jgi:hypothetical protein
MSTLIVANGRDLIDAALEVLRGDGFEAEGTTSYDNAHARLARGGITALVIGGGVAREARDAFVKSAAERSVTVIEGAMAGRDVASYVREVIEPRL